MSGLTTATANAVLDDQLATTVRTAPTGPMKLYLLSTTGTATSAGTEIATYTRPTIAFSAAASGSAASNGAITVAISGAGGTVNGVDIFDSTGTPVRKAWGALTTPRTVAAGDSIAFASSAIVVAITS